ncbi:MAG: protein phosphatase 2C domain-containing protein [Myxococcota bacterium]
MQTAFLRGRDHQQIGRLELEGRSRAAVALSRGGARKTYPYTDPNEDCVAYALGDGGSLAIAADGHHGELGSEAAVEQLLDRFAEAWTASTAPAHGEDAWRAQGVEALMAANRAILEVAGRNQLPPAPTTFVAALVRPEDDLLLHLSVGDSHVFAVDSGYAVELGGRDPSWKFTPFLGYEEARPELLDEYAKIGVRGLADLRAIVLATDGLSEPGIGVTDPADAVQRAVGQIALDAPEDRRAVDTCRTVVETALHAHRSQKAGDNMGCSVLWLGR